MRDNLGPLAGAGEPAPRTLTADIRAVFSGHCLEAGSAGRPRAGVRRWAVGMAVDDPGDDVGEIGLRVDGVEFDDVALARNSAREPQQRFLHKEVMIERAVGAPYAAERGHESLNFKIVKLLSSLFAHGDVLDARMEVADRVGKTKPDRSCRLEGFHYRAADKTIDLESPRRRRRLDRGNVDGRKRPGKRKNPKRVVGEARNTAAVLPEERGHLCRATEQPDDLIDHVAGKVIEDTAADAARSPAEQKYPATSTSAREWRKSRRERRTAPGA